MKKNRDKLENNKVNIGYISPVFTPAIGGGVIYLELLSEGLVKHNSCNKLTILTEAYPGQLYVETKYNGRIRIIRDYPFRAGRNTKDSISYIKYLIQNIQFFKIPFFIRRNRIDILFIHGSFLNNPTTLWLILRIIRLINPNIKLVSDLRDPKLSITKISLLNKFDAIISCSKNITQKLSCDLSVHSKVREIPIIIDIIKPDSHVVDAVKDKYNIQNNKYIFNGSGLYFDKGIEKLIALVHEIRKNDKNVILVVAGKRRHWSPQIEQAVQEGWFIYLGQVKHEEVISLSAGSWIDVNLSSVDSMPRHSLEALLVGSRVLLPTGVPEFEEYCPDFISHDDAIDKLAHHTIQIANGIYGECSYPVEQHLPECVIKEYTKLIEELT